MAPKTRTLRLTVCGKLRLKEGGHGDSGFPKDGSRVAHPWRLLPCVRSRHLVNREIGGIFQEIKAETYVGTFLGRITQAALHRIVMHVSQFFQPLLFAPDVQIVKPPLPNVVRTMKVNGWGQGDAPKHFCAPGVRRILSEMPEDELGCTLFEALNDLRRVGGLGTAR